MLTVFHRFYQFIIPFICRYTIQTNLLSPNLTPKQRRSVQRRVELPIEIWLEIFEFATYVHREATIVPLSPFIPRHTVSNAIGINTPSMAKRTKLSLVFVSKAWREISIRLLYRHLEIRSLARGNRILTVLRDSTTQQDTFNRSESATTLISSGYGQWTRHVEIYTFTRGTNSLRYLQIVYEILKLCPQLSTFSGNWMHPLPSEFLNGISAVLGSSLDSLFWSETTNKSFPKLQNISFLNSFQSLRTLDLRLFAGNGLSTTSRPLLPLLQTLILSTSNEGLDSATLLSMPSLRNLILRASEWNPESETRLKSFLKVHGASLHTIDLPVIFEGCEFDTDNVAPGRTTPQVPPSLFLADDVCPNLRVFTFPVTSPVDLNGSSHPLLRRIGLRGANVDGLYPDKSLPIRNYLYSVNVDKFPRLELIQTVGFLVEAYTDTIIKDIFIWWVEHFEKMGITFLDGEGVLWKYHDDPIATSNPSYSIASVVLDNGIINTNDRG